MLRVLSISICCIFLAVSVSSQIVIESADIQSVGDQMPFVTDSFPTGINFGQSGANRTWDFSGLQNDVSGVTAVTSTSGIPNAGSYPNANQATTTDGVNYGFLRKTASSLEVHGFVAELFGSTSVVNFNPVSTEFQTPIQYGGQFSGTYGFDETGDGSNFGVHEIRIIVSANYNDQIDGWGTTVTPVGSYNSLRRRRDETRNTEIRVKPCDSFICPWTTVSNTTQNVTEYTYLAKETMSPVVYFTYDTGHNMMTASYSLTPPMSVNTCTAPTNLNVTNVTAGGVRLNWDPVAGADHYVLRGNRVNATGSITLNINGGTTSTQNVNNLDPGTNYWWEIMACCDANGTDCSDWSATHTFSTRCAKPSNLTVSNLTSNSARLSWSAVPGAVSYELRGRPSGGNWVTVPRSATFLNTGSILNPGFFYEWQVRAFCSGVDDWNSGYTSISTFSTPSAKSAESFDDAQEFDLKLMPNPAQNQIEVKLGHAGGVLSITDASGKEVFNRQVETESIQIDLSDLQNGVYLVSHQTQELRYTKRLVVLE